MTSISCIVTTLKGIAACHFLDDLLAQADDGSCEVIVVDADALCTDQSRPGLRHISVPGASLYRLMSVGVMHALNDWVLVIEDHGRPMPGLVRAYRAAIETHPDVDLFGGALENVTSTAPWSFATFLYGSHEFWPPARQNPPVPTNANLIVRRSAVRESDLAGDSGFIFAAVRRLVHERRYQYCPDAVIDHVVELTFRGALSTQFYCTKRVTKGQRDASRGTSAALQLVRDMPGFAFWAVLVPARIMMRVRGTTQFRWSTLWRLFVVGLSCAAGVVSADVDWLRARLRTTESFAARRPSNPPTRAADRMTGRPTAYRSGRRP